MVTDALEELRYVIFDYSEVNKIDYNQVLITSQETLRLSLDGLKTFVKWIGDTPSCVQSLTTKSPIMNNDEILVILSTPEWTQITGSTIN